MKKIPTLFKRDTLNMSRVTKTKNELCEWVFDGQGMATRKYDGTCVKIENGKYYKRREIKQNKEYPEGFILEEKDLYTGKSFGWVLVDANNPQDKWHIEAYKNDLDNGTYELIGPKIQGNPEKSQDHILIKHSSAEILELNDRTYEGIKEFLNNKDIEGIVFHHNDGRMAKIKKKDYGLKR